MGRLRRSLQGACGLYTRGQAWDTHLSVRTKPLRCGSQHPPARHQEDGVSYAGPSRHCAVGGLGFTRLHSWRGGKRAGRSPCRWWEHCSSGLSGSAAGAGRRPPRADRTPPRPGPWAEEAREQEGPDARPSGRRWSVLRVRKTRDWGPVRVGSRGDLRLWGGAVAGGGGPWPVPSLKAG